MIFQYVALSKGLKKQAGTLESESLDAAKDELHKLGLSVMSIKEITEEQAAELKKEEEKKKKEEKVEGIKGVTTYHFEGTDIQGKVVDGTIDAADRFSAYKRLIEEYKFTISAVYEENLGLEQKQKARDAGVKNLETELRELIEKDSSKKGLLQFLQGSSASEKAEEEELEKESKIIQKEVDNLVGKTKEILKSYELKISAEQADAIKECMNRLLTIKMSNNFKHIHDLTKELIALLTPKDEKSVIHGVYSSMTEKEPKTAEEDRAYKTSLLASEMREGIGGVMKRLKVFVKQEKQEGERRLLVKEIWIYLSVWNGVVRKLELIKVHLTYDIESLLEDISQEENEDKIKSQRIKAQDLYDQLQIIEEEIKIRKHQKEEKWREQMTNIKTILAYLLGLYIITFLVLEYGNLSVKTGINVNQILILLCISFIGYLYCVLRLKVLPKSVIYRGLSSIVGVLMVVFVLVNF